MDKKNYNKVIVVTGGANYGVGYDIADKFIREGAKTVVILDVDEINGIEAVRKLNDKFGHGKAAFIRCDITSDLQDVLGTIVSKFETVDVLVNSAGIADDSIPKRMMDINATAVIEWSLEFYKHMSKENGGVGGTIINVSSIFGYRITSFIPVYQASKFALMGFTRSLGDEYNFKKSGVRVIAICPGFTETKLTMSLRDENARKSLPEDLVTFANKLPWQDVSVVGEATVEMFKMAKSGTAWEIEGGKPLVEIC